MAALCTVAALDRVRLSALPTGGVRMSASVWWLYTRTSEITDPEVGVLAWVAFGSVILIFFAGSYAAGEPVRCHRLLSSYRDAATASEPTRLETDGRATQEAAQGYRGGDA